MFEFQVHHECGAARAGTLTLPHSVVSTPTFMPVGTQGTVRTLSPRDLREIGAQIVLGNTYHLHVRPGEDVVASLGGLHGFMAWDRPILTDSGGFQVFSLEGHRRVDDDGVTFQSHVDGGTRRISPESAMDIQWALGGDIAMAFDHVVPGTADRSTAADALKRTEHWLGRCLERHRQLRRDTDRQQTVWPIAQGATFSDLRRSAIEQIFAMADWSGIAVGGLAVGEDKTATYEVLEDLEPSLPRNIPRYLMGVGLPVDLLAAIGRGMDLFDCVAPTRNGRNGSAFTTDGPVNIRNAAHKSDARPLDETCDCEACTVHSRGYLRHLFAAKELLVALRILEKDPHLIFGRDCHIGCLIAASHQVGAIRQGGLAFGNEAVDHPLIQFVALLQNFPGNNVVLLGGIHRCGGL